MTTDSPVAVGRLSLLVIFVADLERSRRFYEALGLTFERHDHPPCGEHLASTGSACVVELCQQRPSGPPVAPLTFGFDVTDLDHAIRATVVAGGTLGREPRDSPWGRSATVRDPDGHRVLLTEQPG